jgi:hypothetical protein
MRKPLERLAFAAAGLLVLIIAILFVMESTTQQKRDTAVAEFRKRLPTAYTQPQPNGSETEPAPTADAPPAEEVANPATRTAEFKRLL